MTPENLRTLRALCGITQAALAKKSGVSATAIAEYETGKRDLRGETLRKLCNALAVQVTYTVAGTTITSGEKAA